MEVNDYLTAEEKQQMEKLMKKAAERRKKGREKTDSADEAVSFLYVQCEYERKQTDEKAAREKAEYEADLRNLADQVCSFFQRYGYCSICGRYKEDEEVDEELPFG